VIRAGRRAGRVVIRPLARGRPVAAPSAVVRLIAIICLGCAGCFYIDPVNRGPTTDIVAPAQPLERGRQVTFTQSFNDPEHHPGSFLWKAFTCTTIVQHGGEGCDDSPVFIGQGEDATLIVPLTMQDGTPSQVLEVKLDASDDRGALNQAQKAFPIADSAPTLQVSTSAHAFSVGAPIDVFARYGDLDNDLAGLAVTWTVFTPGPQAAYTFAPLAQIDDDAGHVTAGQRLVAQAPGEWHVRVTVTDPASATATQDQVLAITPDAPPCLAQWQPIAPPSGQALPVSEPTVFQVPLVDDDLDMYPPIASEPLFGTTAFAWSIRGPGEPARRVIAGATGNSLDFDPGAFAPGDIVELRVEIFDRHRTVLPCADDQATCSLTSQPTCLQRQTWRVEVR
jgi:hypothetical protein